MLSNEENFTFNLLFVTISNSFCRDTWDKAISRKQWCTFLLLGYSLEKKPTSFSVKCWHFLSAFSRCRIFYCNSKPSPTNDHSKAVFRNVSNLSQRIMVDSAYFFELKDCPSYIFLRWRICYWLSGDFFVLTLIDETCYHKLCLLCCSNQNFSFFQNEGIFVQLDELHELNKFTHAWIRIH